MATWNPVRILSICDDDGLRLSRELLLEKDGYEVQSIASNTALSVSSARSFDLALICRSIEPERALALTDKLRRYHPDIQILSISPLENRSEYCETILEIPSGPDALLEAIRELCAHNAARYGCYEASHQ